MLRTDNWTRITLDQVASSDHNSLVDGPFGSDLKMSEYTSAGVRLIQLQNIGEGVWIDSNQRFIPLSKFNDLSRHAAYPGDIAIAKMADPVARACIVPYVSEKFLVVADCIKLSVNLKRYNPRFIVRAINHLDFRRKAEDISTGTTRQRINLSALRKIPLWVPSLIEQNYIADMFDDLDMQSQQTEQLIAKLKQQREGLLHDLLTRGLDEDGELRDPDVHPELFKDSILGRIPREWKIETLINVGRGEISNGVFKKPELVGSGYPLVNVSDLYQEFGINLALVERLNVTVKEQSRYLVEPGDCFFTRSSLNLSGIAHCNIVRVISEPTLFECHLMRIRPDPLTMIPEFLAYWCRSAWTQSFFMSKAKQVTMTTISQSDIALLPVPLPSLYEQRLIVKLIDLADVEIASESSYLAKLKHYKQGLMHDLLTGRVRVGASVEA